MGKIAEGNVGLGEKHEAAQIEVLKMEAVCLEAKASFWNALAHATITLSEQLRKELAKHGSR